MVLRTKLDAWLNGIIEAGWLAALVIAPLFFNVFSSRVFEPDKISLIRSIALVMLLAWLVKLANGGQAWLPAFSATAPVAAASSDDSRANAAAPVAWWRRLSGVPLLLPILFIVLAYLISTGFSVARFVSWWGSYQRLQGTYTFLSYVTIALLTLAHLRTPAQIRRLQHAIIITSLPISIYGWMQNRGLDPLPWGGDTTTRVAANAGNAIFLAAYLIMAFFFALERVYSSFAYLLGYKPEQSGDSQDAPTAIAGGMYLVILLVQGVAIFLTQSRGPQIGLLAGIYLFVLLLLTALRPKHYRRWTTTWVLLGVGGIVLLIAVNTLPVFAPLRNIPYVGRLGNLLESDVGTGRVRVLIWQGASQMVQPHAPLIFPDGSEDAINALRPLVGYGPEAMWIAYNPFYPPQLAQIEARNASPDRAHNETWDSLVITGILGFLAYLTLFISIFYWALRWMGLLVNRRDATLFAIILLVCAVIAIAALYVYDDYQWRFFGVALPTGLTVGLLVYISISVFLHDDLGWGRADLPRQLLLIAILAAIVAHFIEIHFGIAIAATRTYFWVFTALLVVLGTRWALPAAYTIHQEVEEEPTVEEVPQETGRGKRRGSRPARPLARRALSGLPALPATVMIDLLIFLTTVFLFTTNSRALTDPFSILFGTLLWLSPNNSIVPPILAMLLFTWLISATLGLTSASLQQRRAPDLGWWLRGLGFHALVVWGGWLIYGLIQGGRLIPGVAGGDLDSQLSMVAGHFAVFTWILVFWLLASGIPFAWSALQDRRLPALGHAALSLGVGTVLAIAIFLIIGNVNIALVRADVIYKQGQQFDNQRDWIRSIDLYRRALAARSTEDHYMLFLGRAFLERAKVVESGGVPILPADADLNDILALTPQAVEQMGRDELLRSAEIVLLAAQDVNPLNTDHTANLARLYRSWSDLVPQDPELRQALLDKSIEHYNLAVQLSPNAAHLWNEKGNAHLARSEDAEAEAAYLHSLGLDARYDQTYLLLADFYERRERFEEEIALLEDGIEQLPNQPQLYSYLGVAKARTGDTQGAIEANEKVVELQPGNIGAMRNLAILHRDLGNFDAAIEWAEQAIAISPVDNVQEQKNQRQLAAEIYQQAGLTDLALAQFEQMRQLDPNDVAVLGSLNNYYQQVGNWQAAAQTLQAMATLEPDNYQHPLALAQVYQQMGQPQEALTYANQALALAPAEQQSTITQLIDTIN